MLQWARANGAPWDEETCMETERNGHYDMLEWAQANGCPSGYSDASGYSDDDGFDEDD